MSATPAPQPTYPAAVPGRTLGIVSLILSIVVAPLSLVWLITSIVSVVKSRKAGASNVPGVIGIIISALALIGTIITIIVLAALGVGVAGLLEQCAQLGPGVHMVNGVELTCS